ncbi:MAG TPA: AzlC family ABC transporter permease [Paracoccaceae bacterium]|nr:AzlC family ABC transporter permease [Paracoccaceae bacterium]
MTDTTPTKAFLQGLRHSLPFIVVVVPFATLFGVVATEAGLDLIQTMGFTALVIAGAAQFASLQMMQDQAPILMVLLAGLAVNMRMAMYSASLVPYLGKAPLWQRALASYMLFDQSYAVSLDRFETEPKLSIPARIAFFFGVAAPISVLWCGATAIGALVGSAIPASMGLDFALPITFIALIGPMLKSIPHVAAAFVSVVGALALGWMPSGVGLLLAAVLAMLTGALVEDWSSKWAR